MQVQKENREITMDGFVGETKQFSIEATPKAFQILSSGVYTDKPLAVIRELSCNAYDAQVDAGTLDKPFEVHLPNHFEPWFSIRDYGTGLSDEDIMGLYTTYFKSTKTNSNDVIGCMGLGSKSPFAYVDQFTVTSFFKGEKTSFMVFMDDEGMPSITQVEKNPTDEPNGIEIHMMANASDFGTFADRAKKFYHRFPVHPTIVGNRVDLSKVAYTMEGPNYKLRSNDEYLSYGDHKGAYAIQGVVAYPIKVDKIKVEMTDRQRELLQHMAIDIDFPIGQLEVAASREELSYNKLTQINIVEAVKKIEAHVPLHAAKVLADAKTEFEARVLYDRWLGANSIESRFMAKVLGRKLKWGSDEISTGDFDLYMYDRKQVETVKTVASGSLDSEAVSTLIQLHAIPEYGDVVFLSEYDLNRRDAKRLTGSYAKHQKFNAGRLESGDDVVVLVDDEKLSRSIVKLIQHNYVDKEVSVYALRIKPGFEQQVKDQFKGFDNFVLASTLDTPPVEVKTASKADVRKLMKVDRINDRYYSNNVETSDTTYDVSLGGTYVVLYNKEVITPGDEWLEKGVEPKRGDKKVVELLREAVKLGLIALDTDNVYAFNSTHKALVTKHANWVSAFDLIKKRLNEKLADKEFVKQVENFYYLQALINGDNSAVGTLISSKSPMDAVVQKLKSPTSKFTKYLSEVIEVASNFDDFLVSQKISSDKFVNSNLVKQTGYGNKLYKLEDLDNFLENAAKYLTTKDFKIQKEKAVAKAKKLSSDFKSRYPLLPHLVNSHLNVKTDSKSIALYINMCDKTQSLIKASI